MARRRVLMLAYYFPPVGGGGVQRTLKHVKYLPAEGFDPVVITTRAPAHPLKDYVLGAEVPPEAIVVRPRELPLHVVKWGFESILRRLDLQPRLAQRIVWPDEFIGWAPGAFWAAMRAVRRYRPDVLYSSSLPMSGHLVALLVKRMTGLPWVADFRDPWMLNPQGPHPYRRISARLERACVRSADAIVVADESVGLLGVHDDDPRRIVIRNGVDPDDVPTPTKDTGRSAFRLSYVGMFYGRMNGAPVFAAMRELIARGDLDPDRVELRVVGARIDPTITTDSLPLSQRAYVDHPEAVAEMTMADALLLHLPPGWRATSGKLYEYLATGHPILCVAPPESLAVRLVTELGAGICVSPDDRPGIEHAIEALYRSWTAGELAPSEEVRAEALRRFSRPALTRQLAHVLTDVCPESPIRG
jgi:glycosyltransferase involved in cell wall biosynthesis